MSRPLVSRVLIVCTANICRSPTAEALMRHACHRSDIHIRSAGTAALAGSPIDPLMASRLRTALGEPNTATEQHRAKQLNQELALWAELILVMTQEHQEWCKRQFPFLTGKVRLFKDQSKDPLEDVADPHQRSDVLYDAVFEELAQGSRAWAKRILG